MITEIEYTDVTREQIISDNSTLRLIEDQILGDRNILIFTNAPAPIDHKREYKKLSIATLKPDQVDTYIDNNVTNIASAKTVLKLLAKGLIRVAKNQGM